MRFSLGSQLPYAYDLFWFEYHSCAFRVVALKLQKNERWDSSII